MAILGSNVVRGLTQQIKVRQEKLGKKQLDPDDIIYNNSNTSWLRIASSVNITNVEDANLKDFTFTSPREGDSFAKNGVLFGTVTNNKGTLPNKAFPGNNTLNNQIESQYGWGGGHDKWGFSPPPGVEGVTVQTLNKGAIRKADISLTAHNPDQFRIIEALYLRLGYTILVEWGHTVYFKNNKSLHQKKEFSSKAFTSFMNGNSSFDSIHKHIENEKKINDYNYDAFIGYISNFNWKFNPDGTYNITINVMSRGALIDSLTTNHSSGDEAEIPNKNEKGQILTSFLEQCKNYLKNTNNPFVESGDKLFRANNTDFSFEYTRDLTPSPEPTPEIQIEGVEITPIDEGAVEEDPSPPEESFAVKKGEFIAFNALTESEPEQDTDTTQYYITLGLLLRFLKNKCSFYDDIGKPIVGIDHRYGESFMLSHPFQNSVDPKVCFLTSASPSITVESESIPSNSYPIGWLSTGMEISRNQKPFKRDIMGIPVNISCIESAINSVKNSEGKVPLGPLVSEILDQIRFVTGNINDFAISYNELTNEMIIIDNVTIPNSTTDSNETAKINVFGLGGGGSFVKDLSFSSKIFPSIQSAVAIAAQNSGDSVGEKVASYSRLNKGLKDRTAKGAQTYNTSATKGPYENYSTQISKLATHFNKCYNQGILPDTSTTNEMNSPLIDILQSDLNKRALDNEIVPPFYIPVELSLTMHGISGFKLHEKFDITPDYILPPSYPDKMNFIIQGMSQDIRNNEWTTKINTLCWPAEEPTKPLSDFGNIIKGSNETIPQYFTDSTFTPTSPPPPPPPPTIPDPNETPNADRLREVMQKLGFSEKGRELSNGGDITSEMADYAAAVFNVIKQTTGISVRVTGGNDIAHQRLSYNSRHTKGTGVDFVITPATQANIDTIEEILKGFAAGNYENARYINEYANPTKAATGKHFHISWGPGTEAQTTIDKAYAEGNTGQIPTYKIT